MGSSLPIIVLATAMFLAAEAIRRRSRVPRYVHVVAVVVGAISAVILWRGGGLYAGSVGNAITLLVPPAAVYFFFFRIAGQRAPRVSEPHAESRGQVRGPDV